MPPPNANTTLSLQLQMKFGNIVGVETVEMQVMGLKLCVLLIFYIGG
jgi:hypothetical protein